MGKSYSGQSFTLGLDPQITKPLDVRESVDTLSDIYLPSTWKVGDNYYVYPSMETRAKDTGAIAVYIGEANNPTDIADTTKWIIYTPGSSGSGSGSGSYTITIDTALSSTSTNPVQNKVIKSAIDQKVDKENGKSLSSNDFTTDYKDKLDGIEDGANKTTTDTTFSTTSENPIANKTVAVALNEKQGSINSLANIVQGLLDNGIGDIADWAVILKEESEFENLTDENTSPNILYFGLEPLEEEEEPTPSGSYSQGYIVDASSRIDGYISTSSYSNGYILI